MTQPALQSRSAQSSIWRGKVSITSLPPRQEELYPQIPIQDLPQSHQKSWLQNYGCGGEGGSYLFELIAHNGVALSLSVFDRTMQQALMEAQTIHSILKRTFPRLLGSVEMRGFNRPEELVWNTPLYELTFPKAPYHHCTLMDTVAQIATDTSIPMRILIQFTPIRHEYLGSVLKEIAALYREGRITQKIGIDLTEAWNSGEHFAVRVFFQFSLPPKAGRTPDEVSQITAFKQSIALTLMSSVANYRSQQLGLKECKTSDLYGIIFGGSRGTVMIPSEFGAHFEHPFPLPRTRITPKDHFNAAVNGFRGETFGRCGEDVDIPLYEHNKVTIGTYIRESAETNTKVLFDINALRQSMSIFGLTRTGKTTFLANLLHDIAESNDHIGQLIFYLKNEKMPFDADLVLNEQSPNFTLPYLFASPDTDVKIEELAGYIASGLGLLDNGRRYIINYCNQLLDGEQGFPIRIREFLIGVLQYLDDPANRYGTSQADIFQATKQRIEALIGDRRFCTIFSTEIIPEWFNRWMYHGAKVVIDLQQFNPFVQRFIVLAILQMIRTYAKPAVGACLERLYVIDEAHRLFFKPTTSDYYDSDNLGQYALDRQLDLMINELAYCGIGGIFADQNPYKLLDSIRNQIGTTVLFRISREGAQQYCQDPDLQEFLTTIPDHKCFVDSSPQEMRVYVAQKPPFTRMDTSIIERYQRKERGLNV